MAAQIVANSGPIWGVGRPAGAFANLETMIQPALDSLLSQVAETVSGAQDLETLTRPLLQLLETVTGLQSTYLTAVDEQAGFQRIVYSRNTGRMQIPEGLEVPWGDTLCKRALEEGRAYTDDVASCWGDSDAARALGIQTYMSQPVRMADGHLFGTLCGASAEPVAVPQSTLNVFTMFAQLIAQQVEREKLIGRMSQVTRELAQKSLTDPLTGLPNRRAMEQKLQRMLERAAQEGGGVQVAFVDLDGFKAINDTWGHDVGDHFLLHIAGKLSACVRPGDLVSRIGGDEFLVLAPHEEKSTLGERLAQATAGPFAQGACSIDYAGASVGVALSQPGETDAAAVLKRADEAMYEVKRARKARRG
jgi:diguanylate cyclase